MARIRSLNDYREFMKDFITRDETGQASPPDSFDIVVENQGRFKSYRFAYEGETKWCNTADQVNDILRKNRHTTSKPYIEKRNIFGPQNGEH